MLFFRTLVIIFIVCFLQKNIAADEKMFSDDVIDSLVQEFKTDQMRSLVRYQISRFSTKNLKQKDEAIAFLLDTKNESIARWLITIMPVRTLTILKSMGVTLNDAPFLAGLMLDFALPDSFYNYRSFETRDKEGLIAELTNLFMKSVGLPVMFNFGNIDIFTTKSQVFDLLFKTKEMLKDKASNEPPEKANELLYICIMIEAKLFASKISK